MEEDGDKDDDVDDDGLLKFLCWEKESEDKEEEEDDEVWEDVLASECWNLTGISPYLIIFLSLSICLLISFLFLLFNVEDTEETKEEEEEEEEVVELKE